MRRNDESGKRPSEEPRRCLIAQLSRLRGVHRVASPQSKALTQHRSDCLGPLSSIVGCRTPSGGRYAFTPEIGPRRVGARRARDEWGGFFDHVAPPRAAAPNDVDPDVVDGKALLGMRVPAVVASALTLGDPANPRVISAPFDHTSILKLIEWRWGLAPLTARDASSDVGNLNSALNFGNRNSRVPPLPDPAPPAIAPCPSSSASSAEREPNLGDLITMTPPTQE